MLDSFGPGRGRSVPPPCPPGTGGGAAAAPRPGALGVVFLFGTLKPKRFRFSWCSSEGKRGAGTGAFRVGSPHAPGEVGAPRGPAGTPGGGQKRPRARSGPPAQARSPQEEGSGLGRAVQRAAFPRNTERKEIHRLPPPPIYRHRETPTPAAGSHFVPFAAPVSNLLPIFEVYLLYGRAYDGTKHDGVLRLGFGGLFWLKKK